MLALVRRCCALLLAAAGAAQASSYDPASRTLSLTSVIVGGTVYRDVAVRLDAFTILAVGGASPASAGSPAILQPATYDAGTRALALPGVNIGGASGTDYLDATIRIDGMAILSVGSAAPVAPISGGTGATHRLTINVNGTGLGAVYWRPNANLTAFSCATGSSCTVNVPSNVYVDLQHEATGLPNWPLDGDPSWAGDCPAGRHGSCVVQMTGDKSVTVTFQGTLAGTYDIYLWGTQYNAVGDPTSLEAVPLSMMVEHDNVNRLYRTEYGGTVSGRGGVAGSFADPLGNGWGTCSFDGVLAPVLAISSTTYLVGVVNGVTQHAPWPRDGMLVYGSGAASCTGDGATVRSVRATWRAFRVDAQTPALRARRSPFGR